MIAKTLISGQNNVISLSIEFDDYNIIRNMTFKIFGDLELETILEKIKLEVLYAPIEDLLTITSDDIINSFEIQEDKLHWGVIVEDSLRNVAIECLKQQTSPVYYNYELEE